MIIVHGISLPFTEPWETAAEQAKKLIINAPVKSARLYNRAVDARHKNDICFVYSIALEVEGDENTAAQGLKNVKIEKEYLDDLWHNPLRAEISDNQRPVIAGFGPAGMFAALYLSRVGLRPVVLERGAPVEERVRDVRNFFETGTLTPESNVQFGEGGAGTFSDGKLTTRTNDARQSFILRELVKHGAPEEILTQAKPHIGTDILRGVVKSIRDEIISLGGEIRFHTRLDGLTAKNGQLRAVKTSGGELEASALILAPGHSARDTFEMLAKTGTAMESKPFSAGVRIEHLQSDVDKSLYGEFAGHPLLPKAEYRHSLRSGSRAVYTFCMCPGGFVVAAASEAGGVVTNGMSELARDGKNANSALVVSVSADDFGGGALDGVYFQRELERAAFAQGGGGFLAPAQDAGSFLQGTAGLKTGKVEPSYLPGVTGGDFNRIFPRQITKMLRDGLIAFDGRQAGFADASSILTGVETRTSSPVRISRGENYQSPDIEGLYPCGEGAGYAGGIMSAAVDGLKCAEALADSFF